MTKSKSVKLLFEMLCSSDTKFSACVRCRHDSFLEVSMHASQMNHLKPYVLYFGLGLGANNFEEIYDFFSLFHF